MKPSNGQWALILGGSGGIGLATARKLSTEGYNLLLVHRDRRQVLRELEPEFNAIERNGVRVVRLNENALNEEGQSAIIDSLKANNAAGQVKLMLHAIASGNVKPLWAPEGGILSMDDLSQTIHAMGTSFAEWARLLARNDLWAPKARAIGLTSEGSALAGSNYAAVGSAKAVLEALARYMARELAPIGIRTNLINAGVTLTRGLQAIPGYSSFAAKALERNPLGRLTTPDDVANVVYLLCRDEADWINGAIIRVDGGEQISGW